MASPAVRTAPAITTPPNLVQLSIRLIDASGDNWSESMYVPATMTDLEIESLVANYQLSTQASVYQVEKSFQWSGEEDSDNADNGYRGSVAKGINLLFKDALTAQTSTPRVIAPVPAIMQGNQDIPLLVAPLTALATDLLIANSPKTLNSIQFTGRRERNNNPKIKV